VSPIGGSTAPSRVLPACLVALGLLLGSIPSSALDEELYATLLSSYTRQVTSTVGTQVDYAGLRVAPEWRELVASVEGSDVGNLRTQAERLAFWINAYNIFTIDTVVRNEPVASIRDLGSSFFRPIWKQPAGRVRGWSLTLDQIEHEILRPLGEPRIHAAIVCASTSCPSLLREPWTAKRLEAQLDAAMRSWMAEPRKGLRIERSARIVRLSRIFEWFEEDFEISGGALEFIRPYLSPTDRVWLATNGAHARIEYLAYDWSLNGMVAPAAIE
jgi:hypothetical protein